jgi:hypothetical protein
VASELWTGSVFARASALAVVALVALAGGKAAAVKPPSVQAPPALRCPVFPRDNPWNQRVDKLPVARNSARIIRSIGRDIGLHPNFGSGTWDGGPIGIPLNIVSNKTRRVRLTFDYADESDPGPYPIPDDVQLEHGSDRHAVIVNASTCTLYEVYALRGLHAGSGAIWNLRSNALRPDGWTSADAAGLPILPGLARYDELQRGKISHALRFTVARSRRAHVYPARHFASSWNDPDLPPMGLRVRLKQSVPIDGFPAQARVLLKTLKRYGMMVADNGPSWSITGTPDERWDNGDLHELGRIKGSDFEVVDTSSLRP